MNTEYFVVKLIKDENGNNIGVDDVFSSFNLFEAQDCVSNLNASEKTDAYRLTSI